MMVETKYPAMMIQPMNPYPATKTAEIMSRYRPIAPKPELPINPMFESSSISQKIRQSPYLRHIWPQLQARPTRTRKRGRTAISPATLKRTRTHILGLSSPSHMTSPAKNLSLHGFAHASSPPQLPMSSLSSLNGTLDKLGTTAESLVSLPPLPYPPPSPIPGMELNNMKPYEEGEKVIDLNTVAEIVTDVPEEKDLLQQLRAPTCTNVIAPQPIRPVGSSISVGFINENMNSMDDAVQIPKKPEEVEEEVESEALPAVISDSSNKVRLANSAYKEMVGQPECLWLDSMVACDGRVGSCKRISGEVMLHLSDSSVPFSSKGFSCWVNIEWGSNGKKSSINAFCDVIKLSCESKDYVFTWRFHTPQTREGSSQSSP